VKEVLKMLQLGLMQRDVSDVWPGFERVLMAESAEQQALELMFITSRKVIFFVRGIIGVCRTYKGAGRCQNLRQEMMKIPRELLMKIMTGNEETRLGAVEQFMDEKLWEMAAFVDKSRRDHQSVEDKDCCICTEEYGVTKAPVELCPGHFICEFCVAEIHRIHGQLLCPVCRSLIL
jgi:hypothetical protein